MRPAKSELAALAVGAHDKALGLQKALADAARRRDAAVAAAVDAGVSAASLAARLGVNRQRVYAMIRAAKSDAE